ncbi:MAG: lytic transglycosylase domain-containing protein [Cypionkella sp.]|nr:lytic transglycosylase domain-containing protein [Cypionkella sp.]
MSLLPRLAICLVLLSQPVWAAPSCADLAEAEGARLGVPPGVMAAISLVETGRNGAPWPWTLNEGGKGSHFDSRDEALAALTEALARGVTNIDVGCMQLNHRWHSAGFASSADMIDPVQNTRYAALFLLELQKRLGSWEKAIQHYHSADPTRGAAYAQKVEAAMGQGSEAPALLADAQAPVGFLEGAGGPLVDLAPDQSIEALIMAAAESARAAVPVAAADVRLYQSEEVSPRLRRRWEALEAARVSLAGEVSSILPD